MSTTHTGAATSPTRGSAAAPLGAGPGGRRVRHQARDQVAVMAFSATASCGVAVLLMLLVRVAG